MALAAGLLTGALLLGGCAATPGTAAVIEGRTVSQSTLESAQQDLSAIITGASPGTILMALVVAPHFIDAAADNGVGVSVEEARALIDSNVAAAGLEQTPTFGDGAVEVVRFTMAVQNLQGLPDGAELLQGIDAEVRALDIDISPRYGELDPESATIVATTLPWIVTPEQ